MNIIDKRLSGVLQAGGIRLAQGSGERGFCAKHSTVPRIDLTIQVGAVTSSVEVTAIAAIVNTSTTDLGEVINTEKVDQLPLNGRNWQNLVALQRLRIIPA